MLIRINLKSNTNTYTMRDDSVDKRYAAHKKPKLPKKKLLKQTHQKKGG